MHKLKHLEITGFIVYFLVLFAVFITEVLLGEMPLDRLLIVFIAIIIISIMSALAGFFTLRNVLNLSDRARELQEGIDELQKHRAMLVSNRALKDYESRASLIRIISPDLYDDQNIFYETILANIKAKKSYQYIIPDQPELISKMERLIHHLQRDSGKTNSNLRLEYKTCSDFPIITAYGIYDGSDFNGLRGFMEIRIGPDDDDTTHVPLRDSETHKLSQYFDQVFKKQYS